ncbi:NAD(P)H-dependent oxidoreductase [Pseudoalteromonas shioyasakiensis]|uniref:NAD(P)H-dependent oxidoreductase n=1 Tax=Pseudoalteromonas TaxID=53246 RepID=UPI000C949F77|nr:MULTISPECIES: NAD(P)H-dependent oxidoreductase [unclassified Pseudoalteromonas]MAD03804.1 oxidoreductase [Pseudoalteromonas sp.]MCG9711170.1 NAD(P)H-dependent oxidoreductase [Pseudoalteromonas sp. Isolate3]MCQ8880581.1 NAD(P)H-dependent oxidoreductase [Pseudoalteromonas shioyasakiensis]RZD20327.1 flavodoxin family protein [Pseudoalteromonas sp. MEBiC 03485]
MKNILILNGNPKAHSFADSLTSAYEFTAKKAANIRIFKLSEMDFNPNLMFGYDQVQPFEPCLDTFTDALKWADHLVLIAPIWWGSVPAKLKGLFDRVFLPGVTFKFEQNSLLPTPLLTDKTARVILTMDTPQELAQELAKPVVEQLCRYTLEYCGFEKPKVNFFGSVILSDDNQKSNWKTTVAELGSLCD